MAIEKIIILTENTGVPEIVSVINNTLNEQGNEIEEIISNKPPALVRWGTAYFSVLLMLIALISWFIKYPDIVSLPVVLTTENPPIRLYSKVNGKIDQIFIQDSTQVTVGQQIALIESSAKYNDILTLKDYLNTLDKADYRDFYNSKPLESLLLGNIQTSYLRFLEAHNSFSILYAQTIDKVKIGALNNEIGENKKIHSSLKRQHELLKNELSIAEKNIERNQKLYSSGHISLVALENEANRYTQLKRQLEAFNSNLSNSSLRVKELETQIVDIKQNKVSNIDARYEALKSSLIGLKNDIQLWEQAHFITASINGIISKPPTTQENKTISANEELFTIIPSESSGKIVGIIEIPSSLPGKIGVGTKANIKLDGYPYLKYGMLQGSIKSMTLATVKNSYLAEITLPNQALTSSNITISFHQEVRGVADVITEDKNVFMRLFERFANIFKK